MARKISRTIRDGPQVQARAHDDVVDVLLGERDRTSRPGAREQLDVRIRQLLLHVLDNDAQCPQQQHTSSSHPSSETRIRAQTQWGA